MQDLSSRDERLSRTTALLGDQGVERLKNARVAVFGLGGVGGPIAEALARSGVGHLTLIDPDTVSLSNINRQVIATLETVGNLKTAVMAERIRQISPETRVITLPIFYLPNTADEVDLSDFDYIADAIDTVSGKLEIVCRAKAAGVPLIAAMGAGNKLDPTAFEVADLSKTSVCPLAKVMRRELRVRGIHHMKVVYSKEPPVKPRDSSTPASIAFVPGVAGMIMAGEIIKDLTADCGGIVPY